MTPSPLPVPMLLRKKHLLEGSSALFTRFHSMLEQRGWNVTGHLRQTSKRARPRPRLMLNHTGWSLEREVINSFIFQEGKCGGKPHLSGQLLFFCSCSLRMGREQQQQQIKRDSLGKHYVGHRPHPLPSTGVFFSPPNKQRAHQTRSSRAHSRAAGVEIREKRGCRMLTGHVSLPCTGANKHSAGSP